VTIRAGRKIHRQTVAIDIAPGTDHYPHRASSPSTH
jgi:hypothetical protein